MARKGTFDADGRTYNYEAYSHKSELTGEETLEPTVDNLREPGYMTFAISDIDSPEDVKWETIANLPLIGWDDVEATLAYDWGDSGSRGPAGT